MIWIVHKTVNSSVIVEAPSEEEAIEIASRFDEDQWSGQNTSLEADEN